MEIYAAIRPACFFYDKPHVGVLITESVLFASCWNFYEVYACINEHRLSVAKRNFVFHTVINYFAEDTSSPRLPPLPRDWMMPKKYKNCFIGTHKCEENH